jgi:hypothetical protein
MFMARLVGSASQKQAESNRFYKLVRWASRAEPQQAARLVSTSSCGLREKRFT